MLAMTACTQAEPSLPKVSASSSPIEVAKMKALEDYMNAMQKGDRKRLMELSNPRLDARPVIDEKVKSIGNRPWLNVKTTWRETVAATVPSADITATDASGNKIADQVGLDFDGEKWEISMGDPQPTG
ncbi:hypothetical protein [Krasilnikovia sp. MM14-A1259]|uniref:hypothetical protein n=1 Tax=Krasilnikovia sp. MM14-A1259 TaxID=3373539 RepID=UPI00399C693F